MLAAAVLLAQLGIVATAPDTVSIDGYAELQVRVTSSSARVPSVSAPAFPAFLVLRQRSAQHLERDAGGARMVSEVSYTLVPTRAGTFTVPPFVARLGRQVARSSPLTIVVTGVGARAPGFVPEIVGRSKLDTGASVTFHAMVLPETVYVGEQATYQLAVFLNGGARSRVRRLEATAPEMRGLLAYDPPAGLEEYQRAGPNGRTFEAHVYQRPVFALAPGELTVPPARLTYAVPISPSFFAREEHHEAKSPGVRLVAVEPPLDGRPAEYDGAVGRLRLSARVDTIARVGEPLALTVTVSGEGNVKLWPAPRVQVPWADVMPFDERVRLTSDIQRVRGAKEFEFLLTPQRDGPVVLPGVRYAYWDPQDEAYRVLETPAETVIVQPGRLARAEAAEEPGTRLPIRRVFRGPAPPPWHDRPPLWAAVALLPVPALGIALMRRPRRVQRRRPAAVRLRAMRRDPKTCEPAEVRAALAEALAERLGLDPAHPRDPDALARCARRAGVTPETARQIRDLLAALESAAYGAPRTSRPADIITAVDVYRAVDREALPRFSVPRARPAAVLGFMIVACLTPSSLALATSLLQFDAQSSVARAGDAFRRGYDAYEMGQFALARRSFAAAAGLEPRSADAWANAGTAAWAAGDTARAVEGWQRALRLEPTAGDVRERLALTPAGDAPLLMSVPMLPADLPFAAGMALWVVGWAIVAYRGIRRRPITVAFPVLGLALLPLAAVEPLDRWIAGTNLVVLAEDAVPRVQPLLGADGGQPMRKGAVLRVTERHGVWVRTEGAHGRAGWIPASATYSIARD